MNRIQWRRVVDMNDRALRNVTVGLGERPDGIPRSDGFDITVASEVMAIFCLANDLDDLQRRLSQMVVGYTRKNEPVTCGDLNAQGAMSALLRDAMQPNLVQTLEENAAFVHGGPFANIAHGWCVVVVVVVLLLILFFLPSSFFFAHSLFLFLSFSFSLSLCLFLISVTRQNYCSSTVVATKAALKLADYVVTEGGFGADLGAEKFFDIKCRKTGLKPSAAVVVATCRALKMHGGADEKTLSTTENVPALLDGMANLERHIENVQKFGIPTMVAINVFPTDTEAEIVATEDACAKLGVRAVRSDHHNLGGDGALDFAQNVVDLIDENPNGKDGFQFLYRDEMPLEDKIRTVATEIYGAADISVSKAAKTKLKKFTKMGYGHFPICVAKNQYSFSADPKLLGAPSGHIVPVTDVRLSAGAEFVVALTGDIMTMPGLPKIPASEKVGLNDDGQIYGFF